MTDFSSVVVLVAFVAAASSLGAAVVAYLRHRRTDGPRVTDPREVMRKLAEESLRILSRAIEENRLQAERFSEVVHASLGRNEETLDRWVTHTEHALEHSGEQFQSHAAHLSESLGASAAQIEENFSRLAAVFSGATVADTVAVYRNFAMHSQRSASEGLAMSLNNLASTLYRRGEFRGAIESTREAVDLAQHLETHDLYATALFNLSVFLREVGQFEESVKVNRQAIEVYRQLGRKSG